MKNRKKKYVVSFLLEVNLILSLSLVLYYLLQLGFNVNYNYIMIGVAFLYYLLSYFVFKRTVFSFLFKNKGIKPKIIFIGLNLAFYLIILGFNNTHSSKYCVLGMMYYPYNVHLASDKDIKEKVEFIGNTDKSAKDYVIELFDKYDVVVLGERLHFENTQWDLIYDIVSDERFYSKVGNIFTEIGSVDYQYLADEYMAKTYSSEVELDKATTKLVYVANGFTEKINYFNFFKKLYKLNLTLSDSLKIRENFTAPNLYPLDVKTKEEYDKARSKWNHLYDSVMADNVIKGYKIIEKDEKRKKCLVITNFTHSFNLTKHKFKNRKNETTYIFDSLGDKVVNVMINSAATGKKKYTAYFLGSHDNGTWDKAFELCGNKSIGFDLKDSPFGKDQFDMNMNYSKYKYEDIYTGFVFYKSKFDWLNLIGTYPYELDESFIEEYKRREILYGIDAKSLDQDIINKRKEKGYDEFVPSKFPIEILLYIKPNAKVILFQIHFLFSNFLLLIVIIIALFKYRKHSEITENK